MIDNGSYNHVMSVLNWSPVGNFERILADVLAELGFTDHPEGTWQISRNRIEARLKFAKEPDFRKFVWMEATRVLELSSVSLADIQAFAARARAIKASHGIFVSTASLRKDDAKAARMINRPPLTILDGAMFKFVMEVENIDLHNSIDPN